MEEFDGLLTKTVLLQETPIMLSLIRLKNDHTQVECVIKDRYLAAYIFRLPNDQYQIHVEGKRNKRNQIVVKHMRINNPDGYIKVIGTPE